MRDEIGLLIYSVFSAMAIISTFVDFCRGAGEPTFVMGALSLLLVDGLIGRINLRSTKSPEKEEES